MPTYDVIVVGAGFAGVTGAREGAIESGFRAAAEASELLETDAQTGVR